MAGSRRNPVEVARRALTVGLDKALDMADPVATRHIEVTRRNHPDITPAKVLKRVERDYRLGSVSAGAAAGLTAVAPNPAAWAATIGEVGLFLAMSAEMVVACAKVHGFEDLDPLQRRVLVTTIMLGNGGTAALGNVIPRTATHWARHLVTSIPASSLLSINRVLGQHFVTKYGTKQGVLVLAREAPLGIGAFLGGAGNGLFAETTVRASHRAFGPVRSTWADGSSVPG